MKYGEVKTQKQNYLVFFRNLLYAEIFLADPIRFLFSYVPFSTTHYSLFNHTHSYILTFSSAPCRYFMGLEDTSFLSALTVSFNPLT